MADTTSLISNDILRTAMDRYQNWRTWQGRWRWISIAIGGAAVAIAAIIATGTGTGSIADPHTVSILAMMVAALTLAFVALRPQAQALAFEAASRDLQKAIFLYECDPTVEDKVLSDALSRGTDFLARSGVN